MTYVNQFDYDQALEPELSDYRESYQFAKFAEFVTLELLNGRDWQDLSSDILMIDLECLGGGYQMALEWVSERVTEDQFKEWLNDD